jgi:hypothetical protein
MSGVISGFNNPISVSSHRLQASIASSTRGGVTSATS